jgi:3-oxoacyl-[acyl-carrier-protein] synthase II
MSSRHPEERQTVITGVGIISPLGIGADAFWDALVSGRSGFGKSETFEFLPAAVAEVKGFNAAKFLVQREHKKSLKAMCREVQMGVVSAKVALDHALLDMAAEAKDRVGVEFGANLMLSSPTELADGGASCEEDQRFHFERWGANGITKMDPLWLLKFLPNMPACHIGINIDAHGPNNSLTLDDAAGMLAVREAVRIIARGHADVMVAGSTGTRVHPMKTIHALMWDEVDPEGICRPFDVTRKGQVVGEGACSLILEEESHAVARGAKIYGRILGAGASCVCSPEGKSDPRRALVLAMQAALRDADLTPDDIGHVNANAMGSTVGDLQEALAIHDVFGARGSRIPVTALKSVLGNSGSGCGSLEFAGPLLGAHHGLVPPTQNVIQPDPACNVNVVRGEALPEANRTFIKVSVTRRGQAAAIVARGV